MRHPMFYRLLSIDPASTRMLWLFLPPVYGLWQIGLVLAAARKLRTSNTLLVILIICNAFLLTIVVSSFILPPLRAAMMKFPLPAFVCAVLQLIVIPVMLTRLTVRYDRAEKVDYHFTVVDSKDYVQRFFAFAYYPYTTWSMQRDLAFRLRKELEHSEDPISSETGAS